MVRKSKRNYKKEYYRWHNYKNNCIKSKEYNLFYEEESDDEFYETECINNLEYNIDYSD